MSSAGANFGILGRRTPIIGLNFPGKFLIFAEILFQVEFDEMGQARGVTSEGETARAKKVVCDPSYLPNKVTSSLYKPHITLL